jgi:hypothetical protein
LRTRRELAGTGLVELVEMRGMLGIKSSRRAMYN